MSDMDTKRLQEALVAYRRNRRAAARARGENVLAIDNNQMASPEPDCLDGIGATPEELVLYLTWRLGQESSLKANLHRAASLGMAVEVGMHEMHSEASTVSYALSWATSNLAEGTSPKRIERACDALTRLTATMSSNSKLGYRDYSRQATGESIAAALVDQYGPHLKRSRVSLEFTDAFKASRPRGKENIIVPVYLNLVRNAWLWTEKSDRDRTIRLDAYTVGTPPHDPSVDPNDPDDGWMAIQGREDILIVEDSGPGITKGKETDIFRPFSTGRFGGTGVGLYLCRRNMEGVGSTVVLDPAGSALGGAKFLVGPSNILDPAPVPPLTHIEFLTLEAIGIANLHLDGLSSVIVRQHADTYADISREALRIRIEGPSDPLDATLLKAADAMSGILEGRLDASALESFEEPSPFSAAGF